MKTIFPRLLSVIRQPAEENYGNLSGWLQASIWCHAGNKTNVTTLLPRRMINSEQASYPFRETAHTCFPTSIGLLSVYAFKINYSTNNALQQSKKKKYHPCFY